MGLLDGDLAAAIYAGFKGKLLTGIIRQRSTPESGSLDAKGDPIETVETDTELEGFFEEYDAMYIAQAGIPTDSVKVNIFAQSCPGVTPSRDDIVKFSRNSNDRWFQLRRVTVDPAEAMWTSPDAFEIEAP